MLQIYIMSVCLSDTVLFMKYRTNVDKSTKWELIIVGRQRVYFYAGKIAHFIKKLVTHIVCNHLVVAGTLVLVNECTNLSDKLRMFFKSSVWQYEAS